MRCFNPHTHEGCDQPMRDVTIEVEGFNPHTHEGCDSAKAVNLRLDFGFNPHTHEGCDLVGVIKLARFLVSIHTPTKGVTWYFL